MQRSWRVFLLLAFLFFLECHLRLGGGVVYERSLMDILSYIKCYLFGFLLSGFLVSCGVLWPVVIQLFTAFFFLGLTLLFLSFCRRKKAALGAFFFLLGAWWARAHHAPKWEGPSGKVAVIKSSFFGKGYVIVQRSWDKKLFRVYTKANAKVPSGTKGSVKCKKDGFCIFIPNIPNIPNTPNSLNHHIPLSLSQKIATHSASKIPEPAYGFLSSILLGTKDHLLPHVKKAFSHLGLYHILVVSGLHLTFLTLAIQKTLLFPCHLLYITQFMKASTWLKYKSGTLYLAGFTIFLYSLFVGFHVSIQRAFLLYLTLKIAKNTLGKVPLGLGILWAATLQSLFFPLNLVSLGSLMSWGAYLIIIILLDKKEGFLGLFKCQLKLTFFTIACLGSASFFWPFFAIMTGFIFPLLMTTGVFILIWPTSFLSSFFLLGHDYFLSFIIYSSQVLPPPVALPLFIWLFIIFGVIWHLVPQMLKR